MKDRIKNLQIFVLVIILLGGLAFVNMESLFPDFFGSKNILEQNGAADIDFPVVLRTKGGMLEVASVKGQRNFRKSTDPAVLGKSFSYCRERASWTAPYKITYRVRLEKRWNLRYYKGQLIARVPELEPSLPVAIDTARTKPGAQESCWFIPNLGTRDKAFAEISPKLKKLANSASTKNFAREAARETIKEFIRTWAFDQTNYPDLPPDAPIRVIFPGE